MYKIEVLIATMHKENKKEVLDLLGDMNINSDSVIVSQCNKTDIERFRYKNYNVTCIYSTERGLSKSRNLALQYASADIVMIADDDIRYNDDYTGIVMNAYNVHPEYDILTFKVKDDKKYFNERKRLNGILSHKVISYEITMRLSSIKNIFFNTIFGTGSSYFQHGEENIFLNSCIKKKKKIMYIPQKIACLMENRRPSTWFTGFDEKYMIDKGALYYELSSLLVLPNILQFVFRKYSLYKENMNCFSAMYYMLLGVLKYKRILNRRV